MINKEEIEDIFKNINTYFREAPKHLNNLYPLDFKQYQLLKQYIEQLEKEKEEIYWQGYIKKQKESIEICKICKYRDKYRQLEAELSKANNTINQYKEREQNLIKYLEKEIDNMGSGSSMYLVKLSLKAVLEMIKGEKNE